MPPRRPELAQSEIVEELPAACASEAAAVEFLERQRWGGCPCCVHCGSVDVYTMKDSKTGERNKRFLWRCRDCEKQFTVRVGTIFEDSGIPLHKWCRAYWEAATGKNGVSALEISRRLQISYKSALFMMHRIRFAMTDGPTEPTKLAGTVEADETYVGGKPRHKGWKHGRSGKRGQPRENWTSKTPVVAAVERGGKVRTRVLANVTAENVTKFVLDTVCTSSRLMTDESRMYLKLGRPFDGGHHRVNHGKGEYVRGDVTTNTIEGFFSKVKRGLNGVFHAVSKEHLPRYIAHFEYMYNTRGMNDGERVVDLIRKSDGKRLTYEAAKASA